MTNSSPDQQQVVILGRDASERLKKAPNAYRTISEVAEELHIPQHRLRSWETMYPVIKPFRGESGRRYYSPQDIEIIRQISDILYVQGYKGHSVMRVLRETRAATKNKAPFTEVAADILSEQDEAVQAAEKKPDSSTLSDEILIAEEYTGSDYFPEAEAEAEAEFTGSAIIVIEEATIDLEPASEALEPMETHQMISDEASSAVQDVESLRNENAYLRSELLEILEELQLMRNLLPN